MTYETIEGLRCFLVVRVEPANECNLNFSTFFCFCCLFSEVGERNNFFNETEVVKFIYTLKYTRQSRT